MSAETLMICAAAEAGKSIAAGLIVGLVLGIIAIAVGWFAAE